MLLEEVQPQIEPAADAPPPADAPMHEAYDPEEAAIETLEAAGIDRGSFSTKHRLLLANVSRRLRLSKLCSKLVERIVDIPGVGHAATRVASTAGLGLRNTVAYL